MIKQRNIVYGSLTLLWFASQMPSTVVVRSSDHHLVKGLVFRPPFEYWSAIQMPGAIVPGIRLVKHMKNEQVKVCYLDPHCILIPFEYRTSSLFGFQL